MTSRGGFLACEAVAAGAALVLFPGGRQQPWPNSLVITHYSRLPIVGRETRSDIGWEREEHPWARLEEGAMSTLHLA